MLAAGVDPASVRRRGGVSALAYLRSMIAPDGHVRYSRSSDQTPVWVTGQVLMALAGKPLPLAPLPLPARHPRRAARAARSRVGTGAVKAPARSGRSQPTGRRPATPARTAPTAPGLGVAVRALGVAAAVALAPIGV
jgi:hypothetical protein